MKPRFYIFHITLILVFSIYSSASLSFGQNPRAILVSEIENTNPDFYVRVSVDQNDRVYQEGEKMRIKVNSTRDGYLYLLNLQVNNKVAVIFPNIYQQNNRIKANIPVSIPDQKSSFELKIGAPYGIELLKAIVVAKPLESEDLAESLKTIGKEVSENQIRSLFKEPLKQRKNWAEHYIEFVTHTKLNDSTSQPNNTVNQVENSDGVNRFLVSIGVNKCKGTNHGIESCKTGAEAIAQLLYLDYRYKVIDLLTDESATKANIKNSITKKLVDASKVGDEIVIYWSSHGTKNRDLGNDESDGMDELLIPYDAVRNSNGAISDFSTLISDDELGRWIQNLDGRRIVFILDACYSGGIASTQKSIAQAETSQKDADQFAKDFLSSEFTSIKDVGQRGVAVLTSSSSHETSWAPKKLKLSLMTYFLFKSLYDTERKVSLAQLFRNASDGIHRWTTVNQDELLQVVQRENPKIKKVTQTPYLQNDIIPEYEFRRLK